MSTTSDSVQLKKPTFEDPNRKWWKEAVVYQVYPLSFCDSNGDGIGDIQGIISKLDYLKELGVDTVWFSPICKSPLEDNLYDISDYKAIHEPFGTLEDVDRLIKELHARDMKMVFDIVVNHTSVEHPWFKESRSSRDNPKRDWYIWKDPKYDADGNRIPPNNWLAVFRGGPAWTWDEKTGQYFLRLFTPGQPDLNWENPDVRDAVHDIFKFWCERGVDGFRCDVIVFISKTPGLPDADITEPESKYQPASQHYANGPRAHEFLMEIHNKVLKNYDLITVGESPCSYDLDVMLRYVKEESRVLQTMFTFEHMDIDGTGASPYVLRDWKLPEFKKIISKYQTDLVDAGGWHALYDSNHDQARPLDRFGSNTPEFRDISAKMLALWHCTLTGTQYVYQGEELGMGNVPREWGIEEYLDVATHAWYNEELELRRARQGVQDPDMSDAMRGLQRKARDNARTPMHWDDTANAGFSPEGVKPWMRVNDDYHRYNVKTEQQDPNSILNFWKKLIKFRRDNLACTYGAHVLLEPEHEQLFAYTKEYKGQKLLVVNNFSSETVKWSAPQENLGKLERVLGNYEQTKVDDGAMSLKPWEGVVYSVKAE